MKHILGVHAAPPPHWVGDGFPMRSLFGYDGLGRELSPFLLLDHAQPMAFEPSTRRRGVGVHPHRGFETVTIVYQGEVEHRDSSGAGGVIGPGDVQWMSAARGILHEEFHAESFARRGGTIEMVQLWVNLPARHKLAEPGYQSLLAADIPVVELPDGAGSLRVIAGAHGDARGPARTFTPIDLWDVRLAPGGVARLPSVAGHTLALVVLRGTVQIDEAVIARAGELVHFAREGDDPVCIEANGEAAALWLSGEPIDEPLVAYGPFVMNTEAQIREAIADFRAGRFGHLPA